MHIPPSTSDEPRRRDLAAAFVSILLASVVACVIVPPLVVPLPTSDPVPVGQRGVVSRTTSLPPPRAAVATPAAAVRPSPH
jgi:hypothetical protein